MNNCCVYIHNAIICKIYYRIGILINVIFSSINFNILEKREILYRISSALFSFSSNVSDHNMDMLIQTRYSLTQPDCM